MWNFNTMKKTFLFYFCLLLISISIFAQDDKIAWNDEDVEDVPVTPDEDVIWVYENSEEKEEEVIVKKGPFRVPDRKFEVGLFNINLGFSNNFMTASEIFKEKVNLNIDKLSDGLYFNANCFFSPFFFNYNKNDLWGFGVSSGLDLLGVIGLNGNMLAFKDAEAEDSDIGAAVFTELKIQSFFTVKKIKFKVKPAVYYPLLYAKPDNFTYTFKNDGINATVFHVVLDMQVYTAFPTNDDFKITDIFNIVDIINKKTAKPGFDVSIGAEYPLSETLGLIDKYDLLDFDVGIDFINIPLHPSTMEDYRRMLVNVGSDEPIDFFNGMFGEDSEENDKEDFYNYKLDEYGKDRRKILRPFKMLISANWRPLDNPLLEDSNVSFKLLREWLTIIPTIGFAINPLYFQPVSFEGGIKIRLSFANLFIPAVEIGYYDRLWKNSLNIAFNFKIYEIDLGVSMQSPGFLKSWTGGGFGATFGLKFGW